MYDGTRTTGAILETRAAEQPEREILRFESGGLTYAQLDRQANQVANALAGLGLEPGDRVAVQLPNGPESIATWFGIARGGFVEVPLNTALRGDLLAYAINQAGCRAVVIAGEWAERIDAIAGELETLEHVVVVGEGAAASCPTTPFAAILDGDDARPDVTVDPFDASCILFTSGTTGPSKGVVLTHHANFHLARSTIEVMEYGEDERLFTAFPLFHANAKFNTVVPAMLMDRGSAVVHQRFSASRFWDICRQEGVTAFNFMGALLLMLFKQPERPDDADNPVRKGYGAPAPPEITPDFEARFGVTLCEVFGSTELGIATANRPSRRKIGSCGRAMDCYEIEIHDEHGRRLPDGEVGEVVVRPREPHIMVEEYFGMPEATAKAFRGVWFHTGDRGRRDADGWFYFVDRAKDAIRRRGENISSWEVEKVINDHPAVAESAVIGVPSELTEEEVYAVVVLKEGAELTPEALLDAIQERLPHFAVPRYVSFVDELPKNPQQRVQKFLLRERGLPDDAWDREAAGYVVRR